MTLRAAPLDEKSPPLFLHYLQRTRANQNKSNPRAEEGLTTLTRAADRILEGQLEESLDTWVR